MNCIIGSNGFLGKQLVNVIKSIGEEYLTIPNSSSLDLLDRNKFKNFLKGRDITKIFNCAAFVGGIAFGYALDYLNEIGLEDIANYENELLKYCSNKLSEIGDIEIYGNSINKIAVISFNVKGIHAYDIGSILDKLGIAVRTGQHCAQPIMDFYQIPGTVRVSFSFYNTKKEIDFFILGLQKAIKMLR